ncbi:hypothetical protein [Vibrio cincinnatiensis]
MNKVILNLLFFIPLLFSFNAYSQLATVTSLRDKLSNADCPQVSVGDIVDSVIYRNACEGKDYYINGVPYEFRGSTFSNSGYFQGTVMRDNKYYTINLFTYYWLPVSSSCPEPTELNQETGVCEPPPEECEAPNISDPETGECIAPPETCHDLEGKDTSFPTATPNDNKPITAKRFSCDTSNMCEVYSGYSVVQTESGTSLGKWAQYTGYDCVGSKEDYENNPFYGEIEKDPLPEGCVQSPIESQGYFCNQDTSGDGKPNIDADIDSDAYCNYDENGKFSCSGGSYQSFPGQGSPITQTPAFPYDPDEIEKPDDLETVEKPQVDNSTEVIDAIKNVNTNLSAAITDSTNKNVEGFNSLNQQLTELRKTNASIGQTIVDQMNQDRVIYEKTESLLLANKKDIVNATVNAASSIKGAIGDQTAALTGSIESLADKICDPSTDERSCQGEHGLTEGYANQAYQEMVTAYEGEISSAISTIQSSVIEQSKLNHTEEIESEIHKLSDLCFPIRAIVILRSYTPRSVILALVVSLAFA